MMQHMFLLGIVMLPGISDPVCGRLQNDPVCGRTRLSTVAQRDPESLTAESPSPSSTVVHDTQPDNHVLRNHNAATEPRAEMAANSPLRPSEDAGATSTSSELGGEANEYNIDHVKRHAGEAGLWPAEGGSPGRDAAEEAEAPPPPPQLHPLFEDLHNQHPHVCDFLNPDSLHPQSIHALQCIARAYSGRSIPDLKKKFVNGDWGTKEWAIARGEDSYIEYVPATSEWEDFHSVLLGEEIKKITIQNKQQLTLIITFLREIYVISLRRRGVPAADFDLSAPSSTMQRNFYEGLKIHLHWIARFQLRELLHTVQRATQLGIHADEEDSATVSADALDSLKNLTQDVEKILGGLHFWPAEDAVDTGVKYYLTRTPPEVDPEALLRRFHSSEQFGDGSLGGEWMRGLRENKFRTLAGIVDVALSLALSKGSMIHRNFQTGTPSIEVTEPWWQVDVLAAVRNEIPDGVCVNFRGSSDESSEESAHMLRGRREPWNEFYIGYFGRPSNSPPSCFQGISEVDRVLRTSDSGKSGGLLRGTRIPGGGAVTDPEAASEEDGLLGGGGGGGSSATRGNGRVAKLLPFLSTRENGLYAELLPPPQGNGLVAELLPFFAEYDADVGAGWVLLRERDTRFLSGRSSRTDDYLKGEFSRLGIDTILPESGSWRRLSSESQQRVLGILHSHFSRIANLLGKPRSKILFRPRRSTFEEFPYSELHEGGTLVRDQSLRAANDGEGFLFQLRLHQ
jgi:hypothetical protein